jgi:hypothetical protein
MLLIGSRTSEPTFITPLRTLLAWVNKRLIQASQQAKTLQEVRLGLITGQAAAQAAGGVGAANAYSGALGNAGNMMFLNSLLGNRAPGTAVTDYGLSGNQISGVGGNASYMGASGGLQLSPNQVAGFLNQAKNKD